MKTKLTMLTVLLVACGGLFATSLTASPGKMHQVDRVNSTITVGSSLNLVRQTIGYADEQLTPNLWQYHNFKGVGGEGANDDCCELVFYFVNDRVESIYLADRKACALISSRITTGKPELFALASVSEDRVTTEIASVK